MKSSSCELIIEDSKRIVENVNLYNFSEKSVLITGASGLVGQYLIATLINAEKIGIEDSSSLINKCQHYKHPYDNMNYSYRNVLWFSYKLFKLIERDTINMYYFHTKFKGHYGNNMNKTSIILIYKKVDYYTI